MSKRRIQLPPVREIVSDVLLVASTAAVTYGVAQIHEPSAWIVGGIAAGVYGALVGRLA